MSKTTIKATETVEMTVKEFFSASYLTREMYDDQQIKRMKKKVEEEAQKKKEAVEFFETDGIVFYSKTAYERMERKKYSITTLNMLKDYRFITNGDAWKFGFYNKTTEKIVLLFGGHFVAKGKMDSYKIFGIAKGVTEKIFLKKEKTTKDKLIAFAHQD